MTRPEVAVVGLGPAGRALAHRLTRNGARVLAVDPAPDRVWEPTYGGWADQLPFWLPDTVIGAESTRTLLVARGDHVLPGRYVVLDNAALHDALPLNEAEVVTDSVSEDDLPNLADVVVDCRGARHDLIRHSRPMQTAYGVRLPADLGRQLLGDADAILMDWRPFDGADSWGHRRASFCYVIPLPDGRILAEETCLAGDPAIEVPELAERLSVRLALQGVDVAPWRDAGDVEEVRIPMLPPPVGNDADAGSPSGDVTLLRFGSAGSELNPITGYSVFAALAGADDMAGTVARLLSSAPALPTTPGASSPRPLALGALLELRPDDTVELFDAFGRLPASAQQAVFDPRSGTPRLLSALAQQWARMPARSKLALIRATAAGATGSGVLPRRGAL